VSGGKVWRLGRTERETTRQPGAPSLMKKERVLCDPGWRGRGKTARVSGGGKGFTPKARGKKKKVQLIGENLRREEDRGSTKIQKKKLLGGRGSLGGWGGGGWGVCWGVRRECQHQPSEKKPWGGETPLHNPALESLKFPLTRKKSHGSNLSSKRRRSKIYITSWAFR